MNFYVSFSSFIHIHCLPTCVFFAIYVVIPPLAVSILNKTLYSVRRWGGRSDLPASEGPVLEVGDSVLVVAVISAVVPAFMSWRPLIVNVDSCCSITLDFCISSLCTGVLWSSTMTRCWDHPKPPLSPLTAWLLAAMPPSCPPVMTSCLVVVMFICRRPCTGAPDHAAPPIIPADDDADCCCCNCSCCQYNTHTVYVIHTSIASFMFLCCDISSPISTELKLRCSGSYCLYVQSQIIKYHFIKRCCRNIKM